jgi:hypothetical protein
MRERAFGLREQQPILVAPDGRVDPRLSECLRRSAFSAKGAGDSDHVRPALTAVLHLPVDFWRTWSLQFARERRKLIAACQA